MTISSRILRILAIALVAVTSSSTASAADRRKTGAAPRVNMCLPPLAWQTYDVIHTPARRDESGKVIERARCTIKHNGVVIHENFQIKGGQGSLALQHHGEKGLAYRNIWVVPTPQKPKS